MYESTAFEWTIPAMVGAAVFFLIVGSVRVLQAPARRSYRWLETKSDDAFRKTLDMDLSFRRLCIYCIAGAGAFFLIGWIATDSVLLGLASTLIIPLIPVLAFQSLHKKRLAQIEEGLPTALQQLASALHTGSSILQGLDQIAALAPAPLDREFALMARQARELNSMELALDMARKRIPGPNFRMVSLVLVTALRRGGDVANSLENLAATLRELLRMNRKIGTATSNGRAAMRIMSVVPLLLVVVTYSMQPDLIDSVLGSTVGIAALVISAMIYAAAVGLGVWLMRIEI